MFRWPSWINPSWDDERERELLEFYGGKDSAGWQHEVAGEHGKPAYGAFNIDALGEAFQNVPDYRHLVITGDELKGCETEDDSFDRLEMLLGLSPREGVHWIGGDLGYTSDPTEIVVFREEEACPEQGRRIEGRQVMKLVLRVHMEHVSYPQIAQLIGLLDRYYSPSGIGVDNGGNGLAVVQELLTLDKYRSLGLDGRLRGYDFGGMTTLDMRDGKEVRKRTKELMTTLISGALQRRQLVFPETDSEIEDQFTTHTYMLSNSNVIYSKGNDHIVDAVRCAMLAHEQASLDDNDNDVIVVSLTPLMTAPIFW